MIALASAKLIVIAALAGLSGLAMTAAIHRQVSAPETVEVNLSGGRQLSVMRYEVNWQDWSRCVDDAGCTFRPARFKSTRQQAYPITGISYFDVEEYVAWINRSGGTAWRLPTAAEWMELASELPRQEKPPLFTDPRLAWAADYGRMQPVPKTLQVRGSFGTFNTGVSDLAGNVWEWTASCAPSGSGVTDSARCPAHLVEGLHEAVISVFVRDPALGGCAAGTPPANIGFRLVADR